MTLLHRLAALSAAVAIGAGSFGAHVAQGQAIEWLRTGATYQLIHAVAVVVLAERHPRIAGVLLTGAAIFAVTLYAMAFGAPRWFGAITPLGGATMIAGWLALAVSAAADRRR
jgi:uncharacterized membrane protein YgdD (TMEM256/DUF423 family)